MKATLVWLGALLVTAATGSLAQAGWFAHCCGHNCCAPPPCNAFGCFVVCQAPNAWGTGCCAPLCNGAFCQPAPFPLAGGPPTVGLPQGGAGGGAGGGFAVHPFARSPRDYFMYGDP
jgi:hypothetical protein